MLPVTGSEEKLQEVYSLSSLQGSMSPLDRAGIDVGIVRAHLNQILSGPSFRSAPRMRELLIFLVEKALLGRADQLRETVIAMELFGRGGEFDPRVDNIVRVQAVRLRAKLAHHYQTGGSANSLRLSIPPGSYVPVIETFRPDMHAESNRHIRIAVPPFEDAEEAMGDAIAEEVLNALSCRPDLQVIARDSSFRLRAGASDALDTQAKLDADVIVQGKITRLAEAVRADLSLINGHSGIHEWSGTVDARQGDTFAFMTQVAMSIAKQLVKAPIDLPSTPPPKAPAFELCLSARRKLHQQTPAAIVQARELYRAAVEKEPSYAGAWAGLAITGCYEAFFGVGIPCAILANVKAAATEALHLVPDHSDALLALGSVSAYADFDLLGCIELLESALQMDPSSSLAHDWLALAHAADGNFKESARHSHLAQHLDPLSPTPEENEAFCAFLARRHDEAFDLYRSFNERWPTYPWGWLGAAWNHLAQDNPHEALSAAERTTALCGRVPVVLGTLGMALARSGRVVEAEEILRELASAAKAYYVSPWESLLIYLGLAKKEKAVEMLELAWNDRALWMMFVDVHPLLDPLRRLKSFRMLREKMKSKDGHYF